MSRAVGMCWDGASNFDLSVFEDLECLTCGKKAKADELKSFDVYAKHTLADQDLFRQRFQELDGRLGWMDSNLPAFELLGLTMDELADLADLLKKIENHLEHLDD